MVCIPQQTDPKIFALLGYYITYVGSHLFSEEVKESDLGEDGISLPPRS